MVKQYIIIKCLFVRYKYIHINYIWVCNGINHDSKYPELIFQKPGKCLLLSINIALFTSLVHSLMAMSIPHR